MTLFAIFERQAAAPVVVAEKFSWLAFLLPPVWAIMHGLWLELVVYVVKVVALVLLASFIGDTATVWLYWLLALWIGFAAPSLRRKALARRGWIYRRDLVAGGPDLAAIGWLETPR